MAEITNPTTPNSTKATTNAATNGAEDVIPTPTVEKLTKKVLITRIRAINPNIKGLNREPKKDLLKIYEELTGHPNVREERLVCENKYLKETNEKLEWNLLLAHRWAAYLDKDHKKLLSERNEINRKNYKAKEKLMDITMLIMDLSADESINEGANLKLNNVLKEAYNLLDVGEENPLYIPDEEDDDNDNDEVIVLDGI